MRLLPLLAFTVPLMACSLDWASKQVADAGTDASAQLHPEARADAASATMSGPMTDAGRDGSAPRNYLVTDSGVDASVDRTALLDAGLHDASQQCADMCSMGDHVCGPKGGAQVCATSGGCLVWQSEVPCQPDQTCSGGQCSSCPDGYRDCSLSVTGCETSVTDDLNNCGGCGLKCLPNSQCNNGGCVSQLGYPVKDCSAGLPIRAGYLFGFQIVVPRQATLRSFGAIPKSTGTYNLVLYSDADGHPDRLIAQSGDKTMTAYGGPFEFQVASTVIPKGNYWLMTLTHDSNTPLMCVATTGAQIPLWQTTGITGAPPSTYPPASASTYISYEYSWNVYVTLAMSGG